MVGSLIALFIPEVVLKCIAIPHIFFWQQIGATRAVIIVFLDAVVTQMHAPGGKDKSSMLRPGI